MLDWFSLMPFWMKACLVLQFLSILVTVICLPLITWKLYFGNKPGEATSLSAEQMRLQQIRDRREAMQHLSSSTQPPSDAAVREKTDKDSRYLPKS